jgi:hypothetical protein
LIEDELPFVGRKRLALPSSTLAREEGVVLQKIDWAVVSECHSLSTHCLDTLNTCSDFDIAGHMIPMVG